MNETVRKNGSASSRSGEVADLLHGAEADLVVVVGLQRRLADARRAQARGVVVPLEPLAGRARPVRRPVEPGRIHVRREALLEAVQLIRADEVHLAGERRLVAGGAQHVGDRRRPGPQLRRVVEGTDRRRPAARQQRGARRGAERRGAVGALEHDPVARERLESGRLHDRVPVGRQVRGRQLIGHHEQHVRAIAHAPVMRPRSRVTACRPADAGCSRRWATAGHARPFRARRSAPSS